VFNTWTEIDSYYEGHFLERVAPGAFDRSIEENGNRIRVLYEHGKDPELGNKPLGRWRSWRDDEGQRYEVDLLRTTYNDGFIIPAAEAQQLGASFRFSVHGEDGEATERPMRSTKWNPERLPERTLLDLDLYEMGPVTFGAYPDAGQGLRSGTDDYYDRLLNDPLFLARFTERVGVRVVERLLADAPADGRSEADIPDVTADGQAEGFTHNVRRQWLLDHVIKP
jgi:hypothetical protein